MSNEREKFYMDMGAGECTTSDQFIALETAWQLKRIADKLELIETMAVSLR